MDKTKLRIIEIAALAVAAIVTIVMMLRAAEWNFDSGTFLFLLWAVSPYICLFVVRVLLEKFTSIRYIPMVSCIVALLMFGFTLLAYISTMKDSSSTYALIFLFVPIYLYAGSLVLLVIGLLIANLAKRSRNEIV